LQRVIRWDGPDSKEVDDENEFRDKGTEKEQRDRLERGKRDRLERKHTREYMDMLAIFRKAKVSLA
jgi:hypothetical protein